MFEIQQSARFQKWFKTFPDLRAKASIDMRIARLATGNPGDAKYFHGIGELRVDCGPPCRIYVVQRGSVVIVLLCGGNKGSQVRDIVIAWRLAEESEEEN